MKTKWIKSVKFFVVLFSAITLASCNQDDNYFYLKLDFNTSSALDNPDYKCFSIENLNSITTSSGGPVGGMQINVPRTGNQVDIAKGVTGEYVGVIVDIVREGKADFRCEELLGMYDVGYGNMVWGVNWNGATRSFKIEKPKESFKLKVTYVSTCRDCWTSATGSSSKEIWVGESQWLNPGDVESTSVEVFFKDVKKQNFEGVKPCE